MKFLELWPKVQTFSKIEIRRGKTFGVQMAAYHLQRAA